MWCLSKDPEFFCASFEVSNLIYFRLYHVAFQGGQGGGGGGGRKEGEMENNTSQLGGEKDVW